VFIGQVVEHVADRDHRISGGQRAAGKDERVDVLGGRGVAAGQESLVFPQPAGGSAEPLVAGYPFARYGDGDPAWDGAEGLPDKSCVGQFKKRC
jgi:hypothetical protein